MTFTDEETALRQALTDATLGQPERPFDRMVAVRRRHVRSRTMQSVAAIAAVGVVVIGTLVGINSAGSKRSPVQPLNLAPKSWQLPWPSRILPSTDEARVAAGQDLAEAMSSYSDDEGLRSADGRLLFAGTPAGSQVRWLVHEAAVTTADGSTLQRLIAFARAPGDNSWTRYVADAPPVETTQLGFAWNRGEQHEVFVLASPEAETVTLLDLSNGSPVLEPANVALVDGTADLNIAHPLADGTLFVNTGTTFSNYPVLVPAAAAEATATLDWQRVPKQLAPTVSEQWSLVGAGNGNQIDGRADGDGQLSVGVTCAGPGVVSVTLESGGHEDDLVESRCDGTFTVQPSNLPLDPGRHVHVVVGASSATLYGVGIYQAPQQPGADCGAAFDGSAGSAPFSCRDSGRSTTVKGYGCLDGRRLMAAEYADGEDAAWAFAGTPWKRIGTHVDEAFGQAFSDCTGGLIRLPGG
jgi:hypothetical protein